MPTTECPDCGSSFDAERGLKVHYRRSHDSTDYPWTSDDRLVTCDVCGDDFEVPPSRLESARFCSNDCHRIAWENGNAQPPGGAGGDGTECPECGEEYASEHGVKVHWSRSHDGTPPWETDEHEESGPVCPVCAHSANTLRGLKIHHSKIHGQKASWVEDEIEEMRCWQCGDHYTTPDANGHYCSQNCKRRAEEQAAESRFQWVTFENGELIPKLRRLPGGPDAGPRTRIPRRVLLREIENLAEKLGHVPKLVDMKQLGPHSLTPYSREFGSWVEAIRAAGYEPVRERNISEQALMADAKRLQSEYSCVTADIISAHGKYSVTAYDGHFGGLNNIRWRLGEPRQGKAAPEDVLAELRRIAPDPSTRPKQRQFESDAVYGVTALYNCFDSFSGACVKAGFPPILTPSRERIATDLQSLSSELNRTPTQDDAEIYLPYRPEKVRQIFGGYNEALRAAGLDLNHRNNIPDEELLEELERLETKLGHPPGEIELQKRGEFSPIAYSRAFGGIQPALAQLGYEVTDSTAFSNEELLQAIRDLADELGRTPVGREMREVGKFGLSVYYGRFDGWLNAVEQAGLEPWDPTGEEHPLWKPHRNYGKGWSEQKREAVRNRDQRRCQDPRCGITEPEHLAEKGMRLHVHHIEPARTFDGDGEECNRMENLITLCASCHHKWEAMAPLRPDTA